MSKRPSESDARRAIDECARERVEHAQRTGEKGVTFESERERFRKIATRHDEEARKR